MGLTLIMRCPKCGNKVYSITKLFENDFDEFDLKEFEGMDEIDFKCKCGYKVYILDIDPRDKTGSYIY